LECSQYHRKYKTEDHGRNWKEEKEKGTSKERRKVKRENDQRWHYTVTTYRQNNNTGNTLIL
jgi:hypothetical protein